MKPVTYLKKDDSTGLYYECDKEYGFPVYTHPVKELTDEEIIELKNALNKCQYKIYPSKKEWECYLVLEKYAERLLRKAQEK